jgi:hypothetical protein
MGLYHVAEPYLIAAGRYHECGPFLDPAKRVQLAADCYHLTKQHEESRPEHDIAIPKVAGSHFTRNVATLTALLIMDNRVGDAKGVYDSALRIMSDEEFRNVMDAAMTGHLPIQ